MKSIKRVSIYLGILWICIGTTTPLIISSCKRKEHAKTPINAVITNINLKQIDDTTSDKIWIAVLRENTNLPSDVTQNIFNFDNVTNTSATLIVKNSNTKYIGSVVVHYIVTRTLLQLQVGDVIEQVIFVNHGGGNVAIHSTNSASACVLYSNDIESSFGVDYGPRNAIMVRSQWQDNWEINGIAFWDKSIYTLNLSQSPFVISYVNITDPILPIDGSLATAIYIIG